MQEHRREILQALYTILIGNPILEKPADAPMKTRFKMWYRLIGSAVEYAAKQVGEEIDFGELFRTLEKEDVEETSLAQVLAAMLQIWPKRFDAQAVCNVINDENRDEAALLHRRRFAWNFAGREAEKHRRRSGTARTLRN